MKRPAGVEPALDPLAARGVADAERAHVGRLPLVPHTNNGAGDGGALDAVWRSASLWSVSFFSGALAADASAAAGGAGISLPQPMSSAACAAKPITAASDFC